MKIATYNLWNSPHGMPQRIQHLINEITAADADVLCLQEVRDCRLAEQIAGAARYGGCFFRHYDGEPEGLCILSRHGFERCDSLLERADAITCVILCGGKRISVTNLHLPWKSALERERQIVEITAHIQAEEADCAILAGDFNCADTSDVHRFLTGDCTLRGAEAVPQWFDLATAYADMTGIPAGYTLDFRKNPRFAGSTLEPRARFDRILMRNPYPAAPPALRRAELFGERVYAETGLAASDHYGVAAEVEF